MLWIKLKKKEYNITPLARIHIVESYHQKWVLHETRFGVHNRYPN